jgi:ketosteroid isomerase-like protein
MSNLSKSDLIRNCFAAYKTKDRLALERLFADDFTFTSPYDDRIDKAEYFARCWPHADRIKTNVLEKIFVEGDEAFVTYKCVTNNGKEFRNTEFFSFTGDQVREINVYFGATYRDGAFVKQS